MVEDLEGTLADRAVDRSVGDRRAQYAEEIRRVLEATYDLIERTGDVDPSLREILAATNLSTQAFYRYFQSKDELFLLLLDDGRRRLVGSLERRMQKVATPEARVRAWVEGVLAQASDARAAGRTRPFVTDQDRLAEAFPREQQASVDLLVDLLASAVVPLHGDGERARRCPRRVPRGVRDVARPSDPRHPTHHRRDRPPGALLPPGDRRRPTGGDHTMSDEARVLGPMGDRIVFENDRVRIWELVIPPGGDSNVHEHELDYVLVILGGDRVAAVQEPDTGGALPPYFEADVAPGPGRVRRARWRRDRAQRREGPVLGDHHRAQGLSPGDVVAPAPRARE